MCVYVYTPAVVLFKCHPPSMEKQHEILGLVDLLNICVTKLREDTQVNQIILAPGEHLEPVN